MKERVGSEGDVLDGSNIRRIVPETQAVLRGRTNSKPSPETTVTYSSDEGIVVVLLEKGNAKEHGGDRKKSGRKIGTTMWPVLELDPVMLFIHIAE